jgi:hypothetical protein
LASSELATHVPSPVRSRVINPIRIAERNPMADGRSPDPGSENAGGWPS